MAFKDTFKEAEARDEFQTELAILEFISQLARLMQEQNVSKAELARRLDTSPAYVTRILRGDDEYPLSLMVRLAQVMGGRFVPRLVCPDRPTDPFL